VDKDLIELYLDHELKHKPYRTVFYQIGITFPERIHYKDKSMNINDPPCRYEIDGGASWNRDSFRYILNHFMDEDLRVNMQKFIIKTL
jgi:hypothetical protein